MTEPSINTTVSGGAVGVAGAQVVRIENQYLGVPAPSAGAPTDLGIARIFQTRTRALTDEYLVSETGPVPFGGRDNELRRLDRWLLDPQSPPRMLVTAPAGRGKSALLVRWMKNLQDGGLCGTDGWQLGFIPISIRIGTNRPEVFYEGLARRLAEITGVSLPTEAFRDGDDFRYAVRDQLDRLAETKLNALIVIDGVDEALERSFDAGIIPTSLSPNVRVLLSGRWQVGDHNSNGWKERLGWDRGVRVDALELDRLGAKQIADVLVRLGAPVDDLTREPGLVERLAELTEGEPILVRYYAEDLWSESGKGAPISRVDLESLRPGFDSFFKRWFEHQEKLWKDEGANVNPQHADAALSVLAFALGPLSEADLLALVKRIHNIEEVIAVDRLLNPLRRWVFGSGQDDIGYVLSHPKISDYLQRNRFAASTTKIYQGFAECGLAHAADLNQGNRDRVSTYFLQFLPEHLKRAHASPDDFMQLVENGWGNALEEFEGGQRGFAYAVQAAFEAQRDVKPDLRLPARWRCALTLSSIKSLGANVPTKLLLTAVDKGVLSIRQAAHFADIKGASKESVELLSGLASVSQENSALRSELLTSALNAAKAIGDDNSRSAALIALIPHFGPPERDEILRKAFGAAKRIDDNFARSLALIALITHFAVDQRDECVREALEAAEATSAGDSRAVSLALLASFIGPEQRDRVLHKADASFEAIADDNIRAKILVGFARLLATAPSGEGLAGPAGEGLLRQAFEATKAISEGDSRSLALAQLAPVLPLIMPEQEALAAIEAIANDNSRALGLAGLVERLSPERRDEVRVKALEAAMAIRDDYPRSQAFAVLAPQLAPEQVSEALAAAETIHDNGARSQALAALAPLLSREDLSEALASAKAIGDDAARAQALAALGSFFSPEEREKILNEALATAKAIGSDRFRFRAFIALLPQLLPEQRDDLVREMLNTVSLIGDYDDRIRALAGLAATIAPAQRDEVLREERAAAEVTRQSARERSDALAALAPYLAPDQIGGALAAAEAIRDEADRARALVALIPRLDAGQRSDVVREAFIAAKAIGNEFSRALALVTLAAHLVPEQVAEAFGAATEIADENHRAMALAALVTRLRPEHMGEALAAAHAIDDKSSSRSISSRFSQPFSA